jgi:hypothetical protein
MRPPDEIRRDLVRGWLAKADLALRVARLVGERARAALLPHLGPTADGLLCGPLAAYRAAQMDPIQALRQE